MSSRYVAIVDVLLIAVAAAAAFFLRFDAAFFRHARSEFLPFVAAALVVKPVVFALVGLYRQYWRYTGPRELTLVGLGVVASSLLLAILVAVGVAFDWIPQFSRSVIVLDGVLTLVCVSGLRLALRLAGEFAPTEFGSRERRTRRRVLVAGAGDSGVAVVREMQRRRELGLVAVGFLDDDPDKQSKEIAGVPVVGTIAEVAEVLGRLPVEEVIIAMPRAAGQVVRTIVDGCQGAGVPSRTVPGLFELLDRSVTVSRLRDVDLADLLRRTQVVNDPPAQTYLQGRSVLVTGAGGSIGREICRQAAYSRPTRILMLGHGENSIFEAHVDLREQFPRVEWVPVIADVRDRQRLTRLFVQEKPDVVFHAAAYKHVPLMELHPEEAVGNNVMGTAALVAAARHAGVTRLVMISTDKAVSPRGLMGATKRVAETIVRRAGRVAELPYVVVRFGNVLGSRGSAFPLFRQQIAKGGPVTVTHPDMRRYFMTIPEAVHLALEAGGLGRAGELFVLEMGEPMRIVDLVRDLIRLSGEAESRVPIVFTGLRMGEKLGESLWEEGARVERTSSTEVLRVWEDESCEPVEIEGLIAQLADAAFRGDRQRIEALLMRLVPTYAPVAPKIPGESPAAIRAHRAVH